MASRRVGRGRGALRDPNHLSKTVPPPSAPCARLERTSQPAKGQIASLHSLKLEALVGRLHKQKTDVTLHLIASKICGESGPGRGLADHRAPLPP